MNMQYNKQHSKALLAQYYRQRIPAERFPLMTDYAAVTFRPGGFRGSFEGKPIRRAGMAVMFTLSYESGSAGDGMQHPRIPLAAYGASARQDGTVVRGANEQRLQLDLRRRPTAGGRGRVIDLERNPSLLETALRMDQSCQAAVRQRRPPLSCVRLPRVLFGFAPSRVPEFRDTAALRSLAAARLKVPVWQLGKNGEVLLKELLHDVWEQNLIGAEAAGNDTGNVLVAAELCPGAHGALGIYEDFSELIGAPVWNPIRDLTVKQYINPARQVWLELGFGVDPDLNQAIDDDLMAEAERRVRQSLGEAAPTFEQDDIYDGLTQPDLPLQATRELLPLMRARLPRWASECCTDADLIRAAHLPHEPLWLSFAPRVQVVTPVCLEKLLGADVCVQTHAPSAALLQSKLTDIGHDLVVAG
jgi:hypothetical protein